MMSMFSFFVLIWFGAKFVAVIGAKADDAQRGLKSNHSNTKVIIVMHMVSAFGWTFQDFTKSHDDNFS